MSFYNKCGVKVKINCLFSRRGLSLFPFTSSYVPAETWTCLRSGAVCDKAVVSLREDYPHASQAGVGEVGSSRLKALLLAGLQRAEHNSDKLLAYLTYYLWFVPNWFCEERIPWNWGNYTLKVEVVPFPSALGQ